MIISYKCVNRECPLYDEPTPDVRTLRADDGKGRVCSSCGEKMRRRDDKCLGRGSAEERREPAVPDAKRKAHGGSTAFRGSYAPA